MVWTVDAHVAKRAVLSDSVHINYLALPAKIVAFVVFSLQTRLNMGTSVIPIDLRWNARISQQCQEEG